MPTTIVQANGETYHVGETLEFKTTITDAAGDATDPSDVVFRLEPALERVGVVHDTYNGGAGGVAKSSTGIYTYAFVPKHPGGYRAWWRIVDGSTQYDVEVGFISVER